MTKPLQLGDAAPGGIGVKDVLFALFKHKRKIVYCALVGIIAAIAVHFGLQSPAYESTAKLLVRYVVDTNAAEPLDGQGKTSTARDDNVMNTELEILTSWDLASEVTDAVTPERLVPNAKGKVSRSEATATITNGLSVSSNPRSQIIWASYTNHDPELATLVLSQIISHYLEMHLRVHRPSGGFEELAQQSDQMKLRLNQTEEELRKLMTRLGVVSLDSSMTALNARMSKGEADLSEAETDLVAERARIDEIEKAQHAVGEKGAETITVPLDNETIRRYESLSAQLDELRRTQLDLGVRYTPENRLVRMNEAKIEQIQREQRDLEKRYPRLSGFSSALTGSSAGRLQPLDASLERGRLAALEARVARLKAVVKDTQSDFEKFSEAAVQIAQLERRKQAEEENAKYFQSSLEKARIDETLNPAKMPNINIVQKPTPAALKPAVADKYAKGLALGGVMGGIVLVLLKELVFDRTVKRPGEVEARLRTPLTLAIPQTNPKIRTPLALTRTAGVSVEIHNGHAANLKPWEKGHFIRPYAEAIRDRLELYFEAMTHKPKLIAVTGLSRGVGVSTVAAGLAAALSRTATGKVLLVDMNLRAAAPFFNGCPTLPLADAVQFGKPIVAGADNLYFATTDSTDSEAKPLLRTFYDLMPDVKSSDFDYIVFDLPILTATSPALALTGFMDRTFLVVEAQHDYNDVVSRAYEELISRRGNVSVLLNKTRSYGPKWLET